MQDLALPALGGCRCERVRFQITAPPLLGMACHCTGCQRMTAGPFSLSLAIPADGFAVTQGEPVIGGLHGPTRHFFCGWCMSWLFTRPEGMDWFVNVRATLLDDAHGFEPFVETFTGEKLPWAATPAAHSFATVPPLETYEELISSYAASVGRPTP